MELDNWDFETMHRILDGLGAQGAKVVAAAGVAKDGIANRVTVDMRHVGQGHEITVPLPDHDLPKEAFLKELIDNFYKLYRELFGRTVSGSSVEVITWRLRSSGGKDQVTRPHRPEVANALKGSRPVYFGECGTFLETPIYDHYKLPVGAPFQGPAVVEQRESTAVVGPSAAAQVDAHGNLVINIA